MSTQSSWTPRDENVSYLLSFQFPSAVRFRFETECVIAIAPPNIHILCAVSRPVYMRFAFSLVQMDRTLILTAKVKPLPSLEPTEVPSSSAITLDTATVTWDGPDIENKRYERYFDRPEVTAATRSNNSPSSSYKSDRGERTGWSREEAQLVYS